MASKLSQPPPGYVHLRPLFADWAERQQYPEWLLLIWANFIALLLNTAASIGDFMVAWRVFKAPPDALFSDDHGIQMFVPLRYDNFNN